MLNFNMKKEQITQLQAIKGTVCAHNLKMQLNRREGFGSEFSLEKNAVQFKTAGLG